MLRTGCFIEIDVDSFQLQVWRSRKQSSRINTMFIWDYFPKLRYTRPTRSRCMWYEILSLCGI